MPQGPQTLHYCMHIDWLLLLKREYLNKEANHINHHKTIRSCTLCLSFAADITKHHTLLRNTSTCPTEHPIITTYYSELQRTPHNEYCGTPCDGHQQRTASFVPLQKVRANPAWPLAATANGLAYDSLKISSKFTIMSLIPKATNLNPVHVYSFLTALITIQSLFPWFQYLSWITVPRYH